MPFDFSYYVEKGVFKRLNSTPIRGNEYFFSFLLSHLILLLLSLIVLYIEAYLFDVSPDIYNPEFIAYSGFSILVILSVGLLLSSLYKNMGSAEAISQVIYQATIFLSGFYFEVTNTPWFIRWYVYFNPVTYLVDGMRKLMTGNVLVPVNIIVPVIWMMASILIFSMSYKGMVYCEK
jgi:ABC-2 type transport system permease protein